MADHPNLTFLSLFVPNLRSSARLYSEVFGIEPLESPGDVPNPHPYSPEPPVVFDFGATKVALYQADGRVTHPGDVGIGLTGDDAQVGKRAAESGGQLLLPHTDLGNGQQLSVFVLPDRHFFEVLST